ncbi:hypothetical protein B7760_00857 [Burkholderia glumae]|uniref:Rhs family protein n=1 Tax=Burkholderia glumae TaxID=337 RepID=UPI001373AEBC|nr:Rhs family protein [Burkholderia glumae]MCR1768990.1 Rhs family protein [Burkholderia glumae]QHP89609.1 Rhs family protein [Burkholderia glumae]QKM46856.1 hypothetical protein B7760_00857 [Burkholderia glumae]
MNSPAAMQPTATAVYIGPLDGFYKVDIDANLRDLNQWLIEVSHGVITVERLKTVAENTPVLANIFAAVDVISDIRAMIDHGDRPLDLFDWLNLGLDLIGVIPVDDGCGAALAGRGCSEALANCAFSCSRSACGALGLS